MDNWIKIEKDCEMPELGQYVDVVILEKGIKRRKSLYFRLTRKNQRSFFLHCSKSEILPEAQEHSSYIEREPFCFFRYVSHGSALITHWCDYPELPGEQSCSLK